MRLPLWLPRLFDIRGKRPGLWTASPRSKPRVRIRQDRWITHAPGQPFPFHPMTVVEAEWSDGSLLTGSHADYARVWHENMWLGRAISRKHNIVAYRIVSFPTEGALT
jgi:hypothetical protein